MVAGDVVNTAARIQAAARRRVLVSAATHRATERPIAQPHGPIAAKGKAEPVEV